MNVTDDGLRPWLGLARDLARRFALAKRDREDDCHADALLALWEGLRTWQEGRPGGASLRTWLVRTLWQRLQDGHRKRRGRHRLPRPVVLSLDVILAGRRDDCEPADPGPGVPEVLARREECERLLARLPKREAAALWGRLALGLTLKEVAGGRHPSRAAQLVARARRMLREAGVRP